MSKNLESTFTMLPLTTGNAANLASPWFVVNSLREVGFAIHTPAAGSPAGVWSFQGSNDRIGVEKIMNGNPTSFALADAARKFNLTVGTVHGSALSVSGGVAFDTYVAFSLGLPRYIRAIYTYSSGGSSSSIPVILMAGRH